MAKSHSTTSGPTTTQVRDAAETSFSTSLEPRHLTVGDYVPTERWVPMHKRRPRPETQRPIPAPYLRLQGRWLANAGFTIGAKVRVDVSPGRLIIERAPELPERVPHLPRRARELVS